MTEMLRARLLFIGFMAAQICFRLLTLAVGLLGCSALGLLIVQHYWLALLLLLVAVFLYEGGYWLLVGRWER